MPPAATRYVDYLNQLFARNEYDFLELLRRVALSEALFAVKPSVGASSGAPTARMNP